MPSFRAEAARKNGRNKCGMSSSAMPLPRSSISTHTSRSAYPVRTTTWVPGELYFRALSRRASNSSPNKSGWMLAETGAPDAVSKTRSPDRAFSFQVSRRPCTHFVRSIGSNPTSLASPSDRANTAKPRRPAEVAEIVPAQSEAPAGTPRPGVPVVAPLPPDR